VKSAIFGNEEDDLSWDFDDEDEDGNNGYELITPALLYM